jgi:1,4-dihydroxy-6-naphthoate synthase
LFYFTEFTIDGGIQMKIAFSPCPNDTFIFHAWVHGLIPGAPKLDVTYADIDITNRLATEAGGPDVLKISYAALPWVLSDYALLPCGGALGGGCGPLVLTVGKNAARAMDPAESKPGGSASITADKAGSDPAILSGRRVAVPSERSTAYLLFRLWAAQNVPGGVGEIIVMPFHEIMPAVRDGKVDAGLVIHEARFTYPSYGLGLLADLGNWWEAETNLPIPLGAIIARRSLDHNAIAGWIRSSVKYAWAHPQASKEYVMKHAQEMSPEVAQAHIDLYVNEYSANLGDKGYEAINALLGRAAEAGLVPKVDLAVLR